MIRKEDFILLGRISRTHGFKGEVLVVLFNDAVIPARVKTLFIMLEDGLVPFAVEKWSKGTGSGIFHFEDVKDEKQASLLCGNEIFIEEKLFKSSSPQGNKGDVIGFVIMDKTLGELGLVEAVQEVSGKRILLSTYKDHEILIPAEKPILYKTDLIKKILYVNLPEGLLDVYQ